MRIVFRVAAACVAAAACMSVAAADALRRFPYPFDHMVSFASDVDMQAPWHGAAIHRVINEELGLPISDSLWVQGASTDASSLFLGGLDLNRRASGTEGHTAFGLLLREWHRGNIDTFHSWQDDQIVPLSQQLPAPLALTSQSTSLDVKPPPSQLAAYYYRHLRLYFSGPPPDDLALRLHAGKRTVLVGSDQVRAGRAVRADPARPPHFLEIVMGVPRDAGVPGGRDAFDLAQLTRIDLVAPSCAKGCTTAVTRVDRDGFSRRTVLLQLPLLAALNVRPRLHTAHGGWSFVQNFDAPGAAMTMERKAGSNYEHLLVPNILRSLANEPDTHGHHSDLLRALGVTSVWSYSRNNGHRWNEALPAQRSSFRGFHDLIRTNPGRFSTESLAAFQRDVLAMEPRLKGFALEDIYCAQVCWGDQGSMVGLLVALSLARIDSGNPTDHLWYTHFASGDVEFKRSAEQPLRPSTVSGLRQLANRHYNFDRNVPAGGRAWVAPAGVIAGYRMVHAQIAPHVSVEQRNSRVTVRSWTDPVTGRRIPDPATGTRDLHGITIYVPDAARASLVVAGRESRSFTRNPPDASGRPSITLVDDSTPTILFDQIPLAANGAVRVEGGEWREPEEPAKDASGRAGFGTLGATAATAVLRWAPHWIALHNTTHMKLAYRKESAAGRKSTGRFFLELEMEDGSIVSATEGPARPEAGRGSSWRISATPDQEGWRHTVLDVARLDWAAPGGERQRPPLPLGRLREVRFGLIDASAGERLDMDVIAAIRPNGTSGDPDGRRVVGGRVLAPGGKPAADVVVEARRRGGARQSTVTDRDGYYFFLRQRAGEVLAIGARTPGGACPPLRGALLDVRKDEVEVDIDLGRCAGAGPQGGS